MRIRITLILVLCLSFLCLSAQERYDFTFRNITLDQVFSEIEDKADISIVYNPREVPAAKRITLTLHQQTVLNAIRLILGADYCIQQKNGIFTIKKDASQAPIPSDKSETPSLQNDHSGRSSIPKRDTVAKGKGPAEEVKAEQIALPEPIVEPEVEEVIAPIAMIETIKTIDTIDAIEPIGTIDTIKPKDTLAGTLPEPIKPKKRSELYRPTDHRVIASIAGGYGDINHVGAATTIFDVQYAYFFHENWGVAAGAGINYFSKPKEQTEAQLLTAYFPVTFRMDYQLKERLRLIGSAGASLELPIDGVYGTDDAGQRYGESILFGTIADVGVAVPLARTNRLFYALGISAYGQCLFTSSGEIKDSLHHQGLYPWQVGVRLSLLFNIR